MSGPTMGKKSSSLESSDILSRNQLTQRARVKHILIGWKDLEYAYGGRMDERAQKRTKSDAEALARQLYDRAVAGEAFEALMIEHSEDGGTASSAAPLEVTPGAELVEPFKRLSLRLEPGEIGIVLTDFGWHIIKRVV